MPKYVPKEDVEKGLVDPTKPLAQQPQYKEKIEKETEERQKLHEDKRPPQPVRPKKERPPRNPRPRFNYNKEDITEQTKIPEAPKKLLEKPSKEKHYEGLDKLKAEREALNAEKRALLDEQKNLIRDLTESKKTGRNAISQYSGALRQKFNIENQLRKEIKGLNEVKEKILAELGDLQTRYNELRKPSKSENYSVEELKYRIDEKERLLTTGDINKNQEQKLNNEINELKRALQKARPDIEIESQLGKLKDQIDILYKELKPIKFDLYHKTTNAKALKAELQALKEQKKSEEGAVSVQRTSEDIKKEFDEKLKAVQEKRDKLEDRIDDYIDKHVREVDAYEDQQDLLHYINWVTEQLQRLKKRKEDEERRKKEKEEYQKRKLKEKQEYQKRKEERKKAEEERKAREQQRKLKLQKQKEAFINRNPNYLQIDLCETLIGYCNNLRPSAKYEDKREKAPGEIKFGKDWQKELKSGAVVIQSKKSVTEEEAPKKAAKPKKKEQKPQDEEFKHGMEVINQFQKLKLLPPNNPTEIDSAIKFLQEKLAIYANPSEQEKAAFREKATIEFEERNGLRDNRDKREYRQKEGEQEQKPEQKEKPKRKEKKELTEKDFPGLA